MKLHRAVLAKQPPWALRAMLIGKTVQTQVRNIRCYSTYLIERARSYGKTKHDYVGGSSGRLKRLSVDKGLLRETESVQEIIHSLVKCDVSHFALSNDIELR